MGLSEFVLGISMGCLHCVCWVSEDVCCDVLFDVLAFCCVLSLNACALCVSGLIVSCVHLCAGFHCVYLLHDMLKCVFCTVFVLCRCATCCIFVCILYVCAWGLCVSLWCAGMCLLWVFEIIQ